jgi:putative transposase
MRRYLRSREGHTFFFTAVTEGRRPILTTDLGRAALRTAITTVRSRQPFDLVAIVLLPDHFHTIWQLPHHDTDYSGRWRWLKFHFTRHWLAAGGGERRVSRSRADKDEHAIWQRRFYEHTCRDEADLKRCLDYVHVNPLKHGLVQRVSDWPWSTFHRYVRLGEYDAQWGSAAHWYGDEFRDAE